MFSQFAKFIISMVAESALVNLIQGKGTGRFQDMKGTADGIKKER
jgi:hypothetical protein